MREAYKALGYRLQTTEPLMVHSLGRIPKFSAPKGVEIERVMDQGLADRLAKSARRRQILPEHFENEAVRQYVALAERKIVGWVRSVEAGESRWCSNMHVLPAYRRRGIARAMMARMLRDDCAAGAEANVLSASHVGAMLYPVVGYEHLATLYVYKLRRK
jgi:ribosomal protein S18 acetylase RimI-like enzyme